MSGPRKAPASPLPGEAQFHRLGGARKWRPSSTSWMSEYPQIIAGQCPAAVQIFRRLRSLAREGHGRLLEAGPPTAPCPTLLGPYPSRRAGTPCVGHSSNGRYGRQA